MRHAGSERVVARRVAAYLATFLLSFCAVSSAFYWVKNEARAPSTIRENLPSKVRYWRAHRDDYDLLFFGDSRTYCNVHPERIDPRLGTRSLNLSTFANWFPTQLPMVRDVIHDIPRGVTVVWSVGQSNFFRGNANAVTQAYPIELREAVRYLRLGLDPWGIARNIAAFLPITNLVTDAHLIRGVLLAQTGHPLRRTRSTTVTGAEPAGQTRRIAELTAYWSQQPDVGRVRVDVQGEEVISVTLYMKGGGYYRTELLPEFFREKQRDILASEGGPLDDDAARAYEVGDADPRLMQLFEQILDEFERAQVPLIVVQMQEAPFTYRHPLVYEKAMKFMDGVVRSRVERRGFAYLAPDFSGIRSEDFFDYDHLNSSGIVKFTDALVPLLARHLPPDRRASADAVQLR